MSKQKYIALLTEGELEPEIHEVLLQCGYELKRASEYGGCITNHYVKVNTAKTININMSLPGGNESALIKELHKDTKN